MFGLQENGVRFGQRAVEIAENLLDSPTGSAEILADMQLALAIALYEAGNVDDAITQLRQSFELGRERNSEEICIRALLDLSLMVAEVSQHELVEEILDQLNAEIENMPPNFSVQRISAAHGKTRLLRRLGRLDDARRVNEETLILAQKTSACPDRVLEDIHGDAALLARDVEDSSAVYLHEMAALEISRRNRRDRPSSRDVRMLWEAADAAIEVDKLGEADILIVEAERMSRVEFGDGSYVYAQVLAIRGRLRLHKRKYKEALSDLEYAAAALRKGSKADQPKLPSVLFHLAIVAQVLGENKKARLSIQEAYDIDLNLYGPDHPETNKDLIIMKRIKLA